jgi:hypothetical protein
MKLIPQRLACRAPRSCKNFDRYRSSYREAARLLHCVAPLNDGIVLQFARKLLICSAQKKLPFTTKSLANVRQIQTLNQRVVGGSHHQDENDIRRVGPSQLQVRLGQGPGRREVLISLVS